MKINLSFMLAIVAAIFLCSCKPETSTTADSATGTRELNTITQATYDNWTGAWQDVGAGYTDSVLTRYFTMPNVDLKEFALHQHYAARFVLGMDTTGSSYEPHLLLVGVDSLGKSMIPANGFPKGNIYDVTRPCPHYCGSSSIAHLTK